MIQVTGEYNQDDTLSKAEKQNDTVSHLRIKTHVVKVKERNEKNKTQIQNDGYRGRVGEGNAGLSLS